MPLLLWLSEKLSQGLCLFARIALYCYQRGVSPWLGARCRFYPSCSTYASQAYGRWGFWRASQKTIQRLLKCHPWHAGGIDLVEPISKSIMKKRCAPHG